MWLLNCKCGTANVAPQLQMWLTAYMELLMRQTLRMYELQLMTQQRRPDVHFIVKNGTMCDFVNNDVIKRENLNGRRKGVPNNLKMTPPRG